MNSPATEIQLDAPALRELPAALRQAGLPITLAEGLIGCETWKHFTLDAPPEAAPLMFLHSLDQPELSFIVADPRHILDDYRLTLSEADLEALGHPDEQALTMIVIVNVGQRHGNTSVTANLLGPLVINLSSGAARQVIQPEYSAHHRVGDLPRC